MDKGGVQQYRVEGRIERERNRGVLEEHQVVELYLLVFHVCTMSCGLRGENTERGRAEETEEKLLRREARWREGREGSDACTYACSSYNKPVGLPSVQSVRVMLAQVSGLHVKKVTEVLDCLWQWVAFWHGEDGIEQVVHIRLEDTLCVWWGETKERKDSSRKREKRLLSCQHQSMHTRSVHHVATLVERSLVKKTSEMIFPRPSPAAPASSDLTMWYSWSFSSWRKSGLMADALLLAIIVPMVSTEWGGGGGRGMHYIYSITVQMYYL